jgi:energy-coupling factor transporter ATP-binding protein EcfA2
MNKRHQDGLLSRFFNLNKGRQAETDEQTDTYGNWADNGSRPVHKLVDAFLNEPQVLIVTGYQDFLSTLSILIDAIPELNKRPRDSIRIVFGTNTETTRSIGVTGRPVAEEARAYFLGTKGFTVGDMADLRAVLAMEAIEHGIISLRAYDPELAAPLLGRKPQMLHAKLFVSERFALSGSANFSFGGLRRNLEFIDDAAPLPDLFAARTDAAERFWEMGRDWTEAALEILRGLVRLVTPQDAAARTVIEAMGYVPWHADGISSAGRPPQPFQRDLIYEAAGTIHEHGFAFVEAPTGAGKTDIGKHLATILPSSHGQTVFSWGERADQKRLGALALIPASVLGNWKRNAPSNFKAIKHSNLSKKKRDETTELEEINQSIRSSAAMIVDESHRLSSRYLAPSARSLVFERSPAIWTACLSATLMGNQGLDGLLAFHEKRASIYVPPLITSQINTHMENVRARGALLKELETLKRQIDERQLQGDLFESEETLQNRLEELERTVEARSLHLGALQSGIADALAPYVVRRQRDCIGESAVRGGSIFAYPKFDSHRRDAVMSDTQRQIIARIKTLAEAITTGTTLVSADPQRAAQTEIKFHDKSRIHIRNFLALLRASVTFAREEWARDRDSDAEQRGRASIGESLRRAERQNPRKVVIPDGALPQEMTEDSEESPTPVCDRITRLLRDPSLDLLDEARAQEMRAIARKHGHVIFLAERVGVLERYAKLLAGKGRGGPEVFVVAPGAQIKTSKKLVHLRSGAEAQEYFGIDGKHADPLKLRVMFMTFQMAEGINLQLASALGIIGVTSDVKSLIQGLGRIDRIDSPHGKIHYYTFDLPGLVLSSDRTARARVASIALLSGVGADDLPSELVEFAAGDLTDLVLEQIRKPRILRENNYFDQIESLRRALPAGLVEQISAAKPQGVWGAELCLLATHEPVTILLLGGEMGSPDNPAFHPPRLIALREHDGQAQIIGDQAMAARMLTRAYLETKKRGVNQHAPRLSELSSILERLSGTLPQLTHWDIRPARSLSLLSSLAQFLTDAQIEDEGRALLGDLTLPTLEKLAEVWAHELDPFWIAAKQSISQSSATGATIPNYLGIEVIEKAFHQQSEQVIAVIRARMQSLLDHYRALSIGQPIDVVSRVSVVFQGGMRERITDLHSM